jgi:superfamily II DNA or RNA helicase
MILSAQQPFLLASAAPPPVPVGQLTPRDYQIAGIDESRRLIAAGITALLLVMATGGGKTVVAALVAYGAAKKNKRCLFMAPRREIVAQAFWKLVEAGVPELDMGIVMADGVIPHAVTREPYDARRPNAPVQVASVQTLANRKLPPADVVFIDEAHHATSPTWSKIIDHYRAAGAVVIGLTATPCRADGRGLGGLFKHLHVIASFGALAEKGFLLAPRVFTTPHQPDLSKVQINAKTGEYQQEGAAKAMDRRELVGDVVEHYQRLAGGRRGVVFAASVEHSQHVAEAFMAAGIRAEHLDGETDSDVRDAMLARLKRGDITIICNYGVLTEGWDEPGVGYVAIARPTKSLSLYLQMAGRGLRPAPGKADALLVDHAGVVHQHGLPQDDREWSLEGRVKRKGAVAVRTCPQCYAALPGGTMVCTECGHMFTVEARDASEIEQVDGELVEASAKPKPTMDERAKAYEGMLAAAAASGRKLGFARHRYRDTFGIWPAGGRLKALERAAYPTAPPVVDAPELPAAIELVEPAPAPRRARRIDLDALLAPPPVVQAPAMEAWTL